MNFLTIDEVWEWLVSRVINLPVTSSRAGDAHELFNVQFTIDPEYAWLNNQVRALDPKYAAGELAWYMSGSNSLERIKKYAPQYERFSDDGKTLNGAYGRRWRLCTPDDSIDKLVDHLKAVPDSRRAVLPVFQLDDLGRRTNDCPCTIALQFHLRDGALHATGMMRSNDIWLGMPYDVFCFTMVQRVVANRLNVKLGSYTHFVGNMHLYDRNLDKAVESLKEEKHPMMALWSRDQQAGGYAVHEMFAHWEYKFQGGLLATQPNWTPFMDMCRLIADEKPVSKVLAIAQEVRRAHLRGK